MVCQSNRGLEVFYQDQDQWDDYIYFLYFTRWWFQICFIFTATWGNDPIWLIFFRWVETTNQFTIKDQSNVSQYTIHESYMIYMYILYTYILVMRNEGPMGNVPVPLILWEGGFFVLFLFAIRFFWFRSNKHLRSHPCTPGRYPGPFTNSFWRNFFPCRGLGKSGVSSQGMWAKSLNTLSRWNRKSTMCGRTPVILKIARTLMATSMADSCLFLQVLIQKMYCLNPDAQCMKYMKYLPPFTPKTTKM